MLLGTVGRLSIIQIIKVGILAVVVVVLNTLRGAGRRGDGIAEGGVRENVAAGTAQRRRNPAFARCGCPGPGFPYQHDEITFESKVEKISLQ